MKTTHEMTYRRINAVVLTLLCLACSARDRDREPESAHLDAETDDVEPTLMAPVTDAETDAENLAPGWCCDCNSKVGKALNCTPAAADACIGPTLAWCELDADGRTSACEAKCDLLGWCCDCSDQPNIECWQTAEDACSYQWCHKGPLACANECPPVVCCDCTTHSCWPSNGLDCDAPYERWCVLEPNVDCFATCE